MNCINLASRTSTLTLSLILFLAAFSTGLSQTPLLVFEQSFNSATIGPNSTTTLQFDISNNTNSTATDIAFSNTLPTQLAFSSINNAQTSCQDGIVTVSGSTISLSGGRLGTSSSCSVSVFVTGNMPGAYPNPSGDLTSSLGNSGSSSATLTIDGQLPGFSKSFSPTSITPGTVSKLTFTVDNTENTNDVNSLSFFDQLPGSLVVASPSNAVTDCNFITGGITAISGTGGISFSANSTFNTNVVAAGSTCTIEVDVTSATPGFLRNVSSELLSGTSSNPSGFAVADIEITNHVLTKAFTNDPVAPGGSVNLVFTLTNSEEFNSGRDNFGPYDNIAFSDDLNTVIPGLSYGGLNSNSCGGSLSESGGFLSFSGGSVDPGESCKISVSLNVPGNAPLGGHVNTTSSVTYDVSGNAIVGAPASDILLVRADPILTKEFLNATTLNPDPVVSGGDDVVLRFNIENTSASSQATAIAFSDELTKILPLPITASLPTDPCGTGSTMSVVSFGTGREGIALTGGTLAAGASCTFDVTLTLPPDVTQGTFTNTTEEITATINGVLATGKPASADLMIATAPELTKIFSVNQVAPGGSVDLTFTLEHGNNAPGAASNISFTDDLNAGLPGLIATTVGPQSVCGGMLAQSASGTGELLTFSGGSLPVDGSCSFTVSLLAPAGATPGDYTNLTSSVTADVAVDVNNTVATISGPSSDVLEIVSLSLSKSFSASPVTPGSSVDLTFNIDNETGSTITDITFDDDLDDFLPGIDIATVLPVNDVCGMGSSLIEVGPNSGLLRLMSGNIGPNGSCNFTVSLDIPSNAVETDYNNKTSGISGEIAGETVTAPAAEANLIVADVPNLLTLTKEFTEEEVAAGNNATIEFEITFEGGVNASGITFSDDLDAMLSGAEAVGLPTANVCGAGSQISGADVITLTGGNLTPGTSCSFSVQVAIPENADPGLYTNTTGQISANTGSITGNSDSAQITVTEGSTNRPPDADAGPDQHVDCGIGVILDGSGSSSPNNLTLTFSWSFNGNVIATGPNPSVNLPIDTNTVVLTVTDTNGETDTDEVEIIVVLDEIDPIITCPPSKTFCEGDVVNLGTPVANDNCDLNVDISNDAPANFLIGTTTVTWTATDDSGNTASCTQDVTILANPTVSIASSELPEFCQGSGLELTATASTIGTFLWSTGETSETIFAGASGIYSVVFTDANGCHASDQINLTIIPEDLLSSYIILAEEEVKLDHNQVILNGGVGVFDPDKKIVVDHNSMLTAATTFAIASTIDVKGGSVVNTQIIGQPQVTLPPFKQNNSSGGSDVKVPKNSTMTLSQSIYKKVEIGEGATVIFTASTVYLEALILKKNSTAEVADCSELILEKDLIIDDDCVFNPQGNSVTVYCDKADIKKHAIVKTNIYAFDEIKADGDDSGAPTLMTGFFIGGKKVTGDHNVTWDWNTTCDCAPASSFVEDDIEFDETPIDSEVSRTASIQIKVLTNPNPFEHHFMLVGSSTDQNTALTVTITDLQQRVIYKKEVPSNQIREMVDASEWSSGIYFLTINSGTQYKTIKLLKSK